MIILDKEGREKCEITQAMIGRAWHVTMGQLLHEGKESDELHWLPANEVFELKVCNLGISL